MRKRREKKPDEVTGRLSRDGITITRELTKGVGSPDDDDVATGLRPSSPARDDIGFQEPHQRSSKCVAFDRALRDADHRARGFREIAGHSG